METPIVSAFFEWQNLIFGVALLSGIALVVGAALGLDAEAAHDAAADTADSPETEGESHAASVLELLGVGRAPLSVFLSTLLFAFGGIGICLDGLLARWLEGSLLRGCLSLMVAGAVALLVARSVAKLVARYVPSVESYATEKTDVVGSIGVAETAIGSEFGIALVTDSTGSLMQLKCRAQASAIEKGKQLLVLDYDPSSDFYLVDTWTEPMPARSFKGGDQ